MIKKIKEEILSKDKILQKAKERITFFSKIEKALFDKAIIKIPVFVLSLLLLRLLLLFSIPRNSPWAYIASFLVTLVFTIYVTIFLIHIIKTSIKSLFGAKTIWGLFISYAIFLFCIILLFSSGYNTIEKMEIGYITYGSCSDNFTSSKINEDPQKSSQYIYYTSVTLFTVGYGDICPMGQAKTLSIINAFVGNFIMVVVMVIAISTYQKRREST